jgi:hypothetical protein
MKNLSNDNLLFNLRSTRKKLVDTDVNHPDFKTLLALHNDLQKDLKERALQIKSFRPNTRSAYGGYVGSYQLEKPSIFSQIKTFFKNLYA